MKMEKEEDEEKKKGLPTSQVNTRSDKEVRTTKVRTTSAFLKSALGSFKV